MNHRGFIWFLLLTAMAWGQADKPAARPPSPKTTPPSDATAANPPETASVSPEAAVITIPGLCDKPAAGKSKPADCKTVVTRAEFEQLVDAVAPTIAPPAQKQLATQYGIALVMVHKAHEMGLDQGPKFQELMRVARIGVLTKELSQKMQDQAGHVSDKEIEAYYHNNEACISGSRIAADLHTRAASRPRKTKTKPGDDDAKKASRNTSPKMP